jgi:hypothetical protein
MFSKTIGERSHFRHRQAPIESVEKFGTFSGQFRQAHHETSCSERSASRLDMIIHQVL